MKTKKMSLLIAGMVLAQELTYTQAMAQNNAPVIAPAVVAGGGNGETGYFSAGTYDINKSITDYSRTAETLLKNRQDINKEDKEYLKAIATRIAQSFHGLIEKKKAFVALGQQASITRDVTLDQYLAQVNELNAALESIKIEIQSSMIISKDTLPSSQMSIGDMKIEAGAGSVIDMTAAMTPFLNDLEKMIQMLNDVTFKTLTHKGIGGSIMANALTPDLSQFPQMTEEEVQAALQKIEQLSVISAQSQRTQQALADLVVNNLKVFVEKSGTQEFLRFKNDNDKSAFEVAYKNIEQAFFARSYLRRKYGVQMGAIQTKDYPVAKLHAEEIFSKELILPLQTALTMVRSQVARTDADLLVAFNNARQFVEIYDKKLTPILSKDAAAKRAALKKEELPADASVWAKARAEARSLYEKAAASFASREEIIAAKPKILDENGRDMAYNSDDTSFLARMSGALTFVTGQVSTTEALLAVMRLVLADIREELMLSQGDWSAMQNYHFKRFMSNQAQINNAVNMMCNVDKTLSEDARVRARTLTQNKVACAKPIGGIIAGQRAGAGNVVTIVQQLMDSYQLLDARRAVEARNLRSQVEAAMAGQMQAGDKVDDAGLMDIPTPGNN